jgi:hypothetical protein
VETASADYNCSEDLCVLPCFRQFNFPFNLGISVLEGDGTQGDGVVGSGSWYLAELLATTSSSCSDASFVSLLFNSALSSLIHPFIFCNSCPSIPGNIFLLLPHNTAQHGLLWNKLPHKVALQVKPCWD